MSSLLGPETDLNTFLNTFPPHPHLPNNEPSAVVAVVRTSSESAETKHENVYEPVSANAVEGLKKGTERITEVTDEALRKKRWRRKGDNNVLENQKRNERDKRKRREESPSSKNTRLSLRREARREKQRIEKEIQKNAQRYTIHTHKKVTTTFTHTHRISLNEGNNMGTLCCLVAGEEQEEGEGQYRLTSLDEMVRRRASAG